MPDSPELTEALRTGDVKLHREISAEFFSDGKVKMNSSGWVTVLRVNGVLVPPSMRDIIVPEQLKLLGRYIDFIGNAAFAPEQEVLLP